MSAAARRLPPAHQRARAQLAGFAGWIDPAVSLPDAPARILALLEERGHLERWPGRPLVRIARPARKPAEEAAGMPAAA